MRRVLVPALFLVLVSLAVPGAAAAEAATVEVHPRAVVHDGVMTLRVTASCEPGWTVLEAGLTVSQDEQATWTQTGIGRLECDGRLHRLRVQATPFEGAFHPGVAYVSAFVIVERAGETSSAGHTVPDVAVHGRPSS